VLEVQEDQNCVIALNRSRFNPAREYRPSSPSVMLSGVGANATTLVETSRGCQSPKMQTQGVLPKHCPHNRISRPHCSARSCQQKLRLEPLPTLTILAGQSGENASYLRRYNQHSRDVSTPRRDDARVSSLNMTGY
jgi:hypothetical protein